jgi:hypothetical protein
MKLTCAAAAVSIMALTIIPAGCKKPEPPSPIVKLMEDAGAGDVSATSNEGISRWLDQHKAVLLEVKKKCIEVRQSNPPANWSSTTEGRVCADAYLLDPGTPLKTGDKKY